MVRSTHRRLSAAGKKVIQYVLGGRWLFSVKNAISPYVSPLPLLGRFRMLFLGYLFVVYCCLMANVIRVSVLEGKRV